MKRRTRGFTLVEILIVLVILSVLSMIALPHYREQVQRTYRSLARAELHKVSLRQEQFFAESRAYAESLEELGYPGNSLILARNGNVGSGSVAGGIYRLTMAPGETSYRVLATPLQGDSRCGNLSLDGMGTRDASGPEGVSACW
jgi:type IV pilus assembly protein PilE